MNLVECPKCGHEHEVHIETALGLTKCQACNFEFELHIEVVTTYYAVCKEHNWRQWPVGHFVCKLCGVLQKSLERSHD